MRWFDYAILRVVPCIERGECLNVGVIVSAVAVPGAPAFLASRCDVDGARLAAVAPWFDAAPLRAALVSVQAVCDGDPATGALAAMSPRQRFHWLCAPRSAALQVSGTHCGRSADLPTTLDALFGRLVGADRAGLSARAAAR